MGEICRDTKHVHVGYLGEERVLPEDIFLVVLGNREEGVVNYNFIYNRRGDDYCEMDVIARLYPNLLHRITEEQYLDITVYGNLKEVLEELGLE